MQERGGQVAGNRDEENGNTSAVQLGVLGKYKSHLPHPRHRVRPDCAEGKRTVTCRYSPWATHSSPSAVVRKSCTEAARCQVPGARCHQSSGFTGSWHDRLVAR